MPTRRARVRPCMMLSANGEGSGPLLMFNPTTRKKFRTAAASHPAEQVLLQQVDGVLGVGGLEGVEVADRHHAQELLPVVHDWQVADAAVLHRPAHLGEAC